MGMQNIKSFTFVILFGIAALGATISPANAVVIYSYTGYNFDTISDNTPPDGSYTTAMSVWGSFTLAAPLAPFFDDNHVESLVLSYSFSDGRQTLDDGNSFIFPLKMTTDEAGRPSLWQITFRELVSNPFPPGAERGTIQIVNQEGDCCQDFGQIAECISVPNTFNCAEGRIDRGEVSGIAGTWTVTSVPEPSALLLFAVGLAGLAAFGWRRQQAERYRNCKDPYIAFQPPGPAVDIYDKLGGIVLFLLLGRQRCTLDE